jgi:hypothetical protein
VFSALFLQLSYPLPGKSVEAWANQHHLGLNPPNRQPTADFQHISTQTTDHKPQYNWPKMEEILLLQEACKTQQTSTIERLLKRTQDINRWVKDCDIPVSSQRATTGLLLTT